MIRESHIDTKTTWSSILTKLSCIDQYMATIGSDVANFNQYLRQQVHNLSENGESTDELLTNLFKGYLSSSDKEFVNYIVKK